MKIAICADTHDNLVTAGQFLYFCNYHEVDMIFHCGDWCASETLKFFRDNFKGKIYSVFGNVHAETKEMFETAKKNNIILKKDPQEIIIDDLKFFLTHYPETAKKLAQKNTNTLIFYGHTHEAWQEKIGASFVANPGTLAGMFYRATFATYDTETKSLKLRLLTEMKEPVAW